MTTGKGGLPNAFLHYSRWEVISTFHKALRQGDVETATYWLQVMLDGGAPPRYLATYLWKVASEELAPDQFEVVNYLAWLRQHADELIPYHYYYAVMLFARAKKWWEDERGTEMRELWAKHAKAVKDQQFREIPHWAHDKHTSRGKKLLAEGKSDRRWEGTWTGMAWRRKGYLKAQAEGRALMDLTFEEVLTPEEVARWDYMEANVC